MPAQRNVLSLLLVALLALNACSKESGDERLVGQTASDRIELAADAAEPILRIEVAEGEAVAAGQVLVQQDTARASASLAEAEGALAEAQARLAELTRGPRSEQIKAARVSVRGAEQQLTFRASEFDRIRKIHDRKLISAEALDQARAALDTARADLDLRRAQLEENLAGTTVEELSQAESAVEQATARRDRARIDLERLSIRAPVAGLVDSRLFEIGERPASGQPVIVMLAGDQAYARVYVSEEERVAVRSGSSANIFIDGLDEPLQGRVRWVSSDAAFTPYFALTERDRGRLSYAAKIDILDAGERLPDGLPVQVELTGKTPQ